MRRNQLTYTLWRGGEQLGETVGIPKVYETGEITAELNWCAAFATDGVFMQFQEPLALGGRYVQTQSLNGVESHADMDAPIASLLEVRTDTGTLYAKNLIITNVRLVETREVGKRLQFSRNESNWLIHAVPRAFSE